MEAIDPNDFAEEHQGIRNSMIVMLACDVVVVSLGWQRNREASVLLAAASAVGLPVLEAPAMSMVLPKSLPKIMSGGHNRA